MIIKNNDFRYDRILYYSIPFLFGYLTSTSINFKLFIILYINFLSLFELMIILNDMYDKKIDKDNNIFKNWNIEIIYYLLFIYLFTSYIYKYFDIKIVISMFLSFILSIMYHVYPRTKKVFPISNINLGLISMYIYYWGGGTKENIAFYIFIYFSIATIFKDWKDIKGDYSNKIYTFPVILYHFKINYYYGFFILGTSIFIFYLYFLIKNSYINNNILFLIFNIIIFINIINILFIKKIEEKYYMLYLVNIAFFMFLICYFFY